VLSYGWNLIGLRIVIKFAKYRKMTYSAEIFNLRNKVLQRIIMERISRTWFACLKSECRYVQFYSTRCCLSFWFPCQELTCRNATNLLEVVRIFILNRSRSVVSFASWSWPRAWYDRTMPYVLTWVFSFLRKRRKKILQKFKMRPFLAEGLKNTVFLRW
jgi:hypothetical protein